MGEQGGIESLSLFQSGESDVESDLHQQQPEHGYQRPPAHLAPQTGVMMRSGQPLPPPAGAPLRIDMRRAPNGVPMMQPTQLYPLQQTHQKRKYGVFDKIAYMSRESAGTYWLVLACIVATTAMPSIGAGGVAATYGMAQLAVTLMFGAVGNPIALLSRKLWRWHSRDSVDNVGWIMLFVVMIAEFVSAMLAGITAKWCFSLDVSKAVPDVSSMIAILNGNGVDVGLPIGSAIAIEIIVSAMLIAAFHVKFHETMALQSAIVIAAATTACTFISIAYTGACFNPAYHLATNTVAVEMQPFRATCYVYYVFPFVGAIIGGGVSAFLSVDHRAAWEETLLKIKRV